MEVTRRQTLVLGASAVAALATVGVSFPAEAKTTVEGLIEKFTGGKTPAEGKVTLSTPEIAENGNTVPVGFEVESPMTADNYVAAVVLFADGNPRPDVATFEFSPMSGKAAASTRIRLAKTQNIVAVAKMSDGSFVMAKKPVKVTIGGCGG